MCNEGTTRLAARVATLLLLSSGAHAANPAAAPDSACAQLLNKSVPASAIALPTTGAVVTSATQVAVNVSAGTVALPAYCKVLVSISAFDPTAPAIQFELDLPTMWNRKLLMLGGGGFDGTIPNTTGNVPAGPYDRPVPLARGLPSRSLTFSDR